MLSASFYSALARSILAGEPAVDSIAGRLSGTLGENWRWIRTLARHYVNTFGTQVRPKRRGVIEFLKADEGLRRAEIKHKGKLRVEQWLTEPIAMQPANAARTWPIPAIKTVGELAAWLGLSAGELEWFADLKRLCART